MAENKLLMLKDGDAMRMQSAEAPSEGEIVKQKLEGSVKKKRRRGKYKRKITKPFIKLPWHDRRKNDKSQRNHNRFRKIVLSKTHAPFNNNQFLMEIHKPEPENNFNINETPARTRDSSFSIDSEDNYFYSLPDDEEDYLTKEFSSVYEDAQSERLASMSKNELIQEYLLLEAKYDNLVKRTERSKDKPLEDGTGSEKDTSFMDNDSMITERDTSGTSVESSVTDIPQCNALLQRIKDQEEQLHTLEIANEKMRLEIEHLHQRNRSSSEDSESDSSSSSDSDSSSSSSVASELSEPVGNGDSNAVQHNGQTENNEDPAIVHPIPMVNGFHSPKE